jgi:hypothetical protein
MSEQKFRVGDVVKHIPSGETWCVGGVSNGNYVHPLGWPPSAAPAQDCEMVEAASDEKHREVLSDILLDSNGRRQHVASETIDRLAEIEALTLFSPEATEEIGLLLAEFAQLSSKLAELQQQIAKTRMIELRRVLGFTELEAKSK